MRQAMGQSFAASRTASVHRARWGTRDLRRRQRYFPNRLTDKDMALLAVARAKFHLPMGRRSAAVERESEWKWGLYTSLHRLFVGTAR